VSANLTAAGLAALTDWIGADLWRIRCPWSCGVCVSWHASPCPMRHSPQHLLGPRHIHRQCSSSAGAYRRPPRPPLAHRCHRCRPHLCTPPAHQPSRLGGAFGDLLVAVLRLYSHFARRLRLLLPPPLSGFSYLMRAAYVLEQGSNEWRATGWFIRLAVVCRLTPATGLPLVLSADLVCPSAEQGGLSLIAFRHGHLQPIRSPTELPGGQP